MAQSTYTLKEISETLGVPKYTVSRLCNSGLIPHVRRDKGVRILTLEQFDLLAILLQMKQHGFSSSELRQYSRLYRQGGSTADQRLAILTTRKHQLWREIKQRQEAIDFIERQEELRAVDS